MSIKERREIRKIADGFGLTCLPEEDRGKHFWMVFGNGAGYEMIYAVHKGARSNPNAIFEARTRLRKFSKGRYDGLHIRSKVQNDRSEQRHQLSAH